MKRRAFTLALPALPFAERMLASPAWAQGDDWPKNNVRIVCPFTPGGSQDNIARRLAVKLSESLGQTFVVENRTGAGGSIAADNVAKSPPDGYSVLLGNIGSHALVPHLYRKPAYNAFTDLETVAWIGTQPNLLCGLGWTLQPNPLCSRPSTGESLRPHLWVRQCRLATAVSLPHCTGRRRHWHGRL